MSTTPNLGITNIAAGLRQPEVPINNALALLDSIFGGYLPIANGDANYTLQDIDGARESRNLALKFTSTLTAARNIIIDTTTSGKYSSRLLLIWNATSGGYTLTVKTTVGGGSNTINVAAGKARLIFHDGTNVYALTPEIDATTGAAAGTGTVTSVDGSGGVETTTGSPFTTSGTLRGAHAVNAQTGTTYTVVDGDRGKLVTFTNASAIAVTQPQAGSGGNFPSKWFCWFQNRGAGAVTITPTTSTIDGAASLVLLTGQGCLVISDGTNYFTVRGFSVDPTAWSSWTPTWTNVTVGNGTVTAAYKQIGKTVFCRLVFVLGSTSAVSGDITFTLPVTKATYAGVSGTPLGEGKAFDAAPVVITYPGQVISVPTDATIARLRFQDASGTYLVSAVAGANIPFTWTTSDEIAIEFFYEAA